MMPHSFGNYRGTAGVHKPLTRLLHWSVFMSLLIAAGSIIARVYVDGSTERQLLLKIHQSAGLAVLGLTLMRLVWRPFAQVGILHSRLPPALRISGAVGHAALYLAVLALTLLGWLTNDAFGHRLHFLGVIEMPALIGRNRDLGDDLQSWHGNLAWLLLILVLGHIAAALWHHFYRRDDVLRSMAPFIPRDHSHAFLWVFLVILYSFASPARAVPSFSAQTGQACAACHIGAYGPQLTPYGSRFKIEGYTETGGDNGNKSIPLDLMFVESFTRTNEAQNSAPAAHFATNDNFAMDELSLQLSGGLTEHIGTYWEWSYNQIERKISTENMDLRYTTAYPLGGRDAIFGISVNNNPTVSDPFNTLPAIKFPYMMSNLTPMPGGSPLLAGTLAKQVVGAGAYTFLDKSWYLEIGGYKTLSSALLQKIHVDNSAGAIDGTAPYWRLAYTQDYRKQAFSVGFVGMNAHLLPDRLPGATDDYRDIGVDGSYQFLGDRTNIFTVNADYIHEHQNLYASWLASTAGQASHTLNSFQLDASYFFHQSYGLTAGWFDNRSTQDSLLYVPYPDTGSRTGKPDSAGTTLEFDWTPFGRDLSWRSPWANVRVGLQYVAYAKFNGSSHNYDGFGRNAADNDTLYISLSTIF